MPGRGLPKSPATERHERPPTAPTKRRGPQKNGGVVGLYDYNVGRKPYEQRTPFERQQGR